MDPHTGFVQGLGGRASISSTSSTTTWRRRDARWGRTFKPFVYATAIREGTGALPGTAQPEDLLRHAARPAGLVPREQRRGQVRWHGDGGIRARQFDQHDHRLADEAVRPGSGHRARAAHGREEPVGRRAFAVPGRRRPDAGRDDRRLRQPSPTKGVYIEPIVFTRIEDKNGNAIYDVTPKTEEALDERTAYIMLDMLKRVVDGAYNPSDKDVGHGMRLRMSWGKRGKYGGHQVPDGGQDRAPRRTTAMAGSSASRPTW